MLVRWSQMSSHHVSHLKGHSANLRTYVCCWKGNWNLNSFRWRIPFIHARLQEFYDSSPLPPDQLCLWKEAGFQHPSLSFHTAPSPTCLKALSSFLICILGHKDATQPKKKENNSLSNGLGFDHYSTVSPILCAGLSLCNRWSLHTDLWVCNLCSQKAGLPQGTNPFQSTFFYSSFSRCLLV